MFQIEALRQEIEERAAQQVKREVLIDTILLSENDSVANVEDVQIQEAEPAKAASRLAQVLCCKQAFDRCKVQ